MEGSPVTESAAHPRALTLFLTGTPFGSQAAHTALNLAEAALAKGYQANLFASVDGVYSASAGQKAVGLPQVGERLPALMEQGLRIDLCGSCLQLRGLRRESRVEGAQASSLKNLFAMMAESRAFVAVGQ